MRRIIFILCLLVLISCEPVPDVEPVNLNKNIALEVGRVGDKTVETGGRLLYNYTLLNVGHNEDYDVAMEMRMRLKSTGEIVSRDAAIAEMGSLVSHEEAGFAIPKGIASGEYELIIVAKYEDQEEEGTIRFTVVPGEEDKAAQEAEEKAEAEKKAAEEAEKAAEEAREEVEEGKEDDITIVVEQESENTTEEKDESLQEEEVLVNTTIHKVLIHEYAYHPRELNISVGDTVEWHNNDSVPHSASGPGFDSGPLATGDSFSFTFDKAVIKPYSSTYTEGPEGIIYIR